MPDHVHLTPVPAAGKKPYVAQIVGTDPTYKYAREFVQGQLIYDPGIYEIPVGDNKEYFLIAKGEGDVGMKSAQITYSELKKYVPDWLDDLSEGRVTLEYSSARTAWVPKRETVVKPVIVNEMTPAQRQAIIDAKELATAAEGLIKAITILGVAGSGIDMQIAEIQRLIGDIQGVQIEDDPDDEAPINPDATLSGFDDLDDIPF